MDISIIIPLYKRTGWIEKCLENIKQQNYERDFEVIVVDDGSPNETEIQKSIERYSMPENISLQYVRQKHAGPAAARNYGVRCSTGMFLCFMDDDSLPNKEWLREITQPFYQLSYAGLVSGRTLSLDRRKGLSLLLEKSVYSKKSWATCNIAYRRDVFETLRGFDEAFPKASWEDNDLGLRAKWAGYSHIYNENAIVYHPHEQSLLEYKQKCILNGMGAAIFSRKYILKKPLWGIGTPLIMSRYLLNFIISFLWLKSTYSKTYLKFLWSFYSIQGFFGEIFRKRSY